MHRWIHLRNDLFQRKVCGIGVLFVGRSKYRGNGEQAQVFHIDRQALARVQQRHLCLLEFTHSPALITRLASPHQLASSEYRSRSSRDFSLNFHAPLKRLPRSSSALPIPLVFFRFLSTGQDKDGRIPAGRVVADAFFPIWNAPSSPFLENFNTL